MKRREYTFTEKKDTRSGFGDGLYEIGANNDKIIALCADLTGSLKMGKFKEDFPRSIFIKMTYQRGYDFFNLKKLIFIPFN